MSRLPLYLDCTIRDGGYINGWDFSFPFAKALYRAVSKAGIDYFEAGFLDATATAGLPWTHLSAETIQALKDDTPRGAQISALINFGSIDLAAIPARSSLTPDLLRVACHKKDAVAATAFAADLKRKGYASSVNFMGISNYDNADILRLLHIINEYAALVDFFYVADSFGSLLPKRTREIFTTLRFGTNARLGFHPHNNLQLAFANTLEAMEAGIDIIDGSVFGMGRGAGNLFTDAVIAYFEQLQPERFRVEPILQFADLHMAQLKEQWDWGYSLPQLLSGLLKCHPNYPSNLLMEKSYTADAIFTMLKSLEVDQRARYSKSQLTDLKVKYLAHRASVVQDHNADLLLNLRDQHNGKVLIVCGGPSVKREAVAIQDFIASQNPLIVTVNNSQLDFPFHAVFFGNLRRYLQKDSARLLDKLILLGLEIEKDLVEDIKSIVQIKPAIPCGTQFLPTNSGIEAALFFLSSGFQHLYYCGLDGFSETDNYFYQESDPVVAVDEIEKNNRIIVNEWSALAAVAQANHVNLRMITIPFLELRNVQI